MSIHTPTKLISTIEASRAARPSAPVVVTASTPADQFSLQRMAQLGQRLPDNAVEIKESKALAQITGIGERRVGELISLSRLAKFAQRDLSASTATAGGDLIQDTLTDGIVGALHPHSVVVKLGAQVWPNQKGGFVSPVLSTGASGYVASGENQTVTVDTAAQFNALELQPIRLSTELHVSRHLVIQAKDRSLEQFLANEILKSLGALLDKVVLNGSTGGRATAPGLVNNKSLPSITFGGTPTWSKILAARYAVNNANFPNDKRGWAVSPNAAQVLAATPKVAGYPSFLADLDLGQIAGDRFEETTNLAGTDQILYGRFAEASVVIWNGVLDVLFDPYSLPHQNLIRILVNVMANGGPLRPGFCYSTDSAAQ
jgi:HK97 family phage major capsid protein